MSCYGTKKTSEPIRKYFIELDENGMRHIHSSNNIYILLQNQNIDRESRVKSKYAPDGHWQWTDKLHNMEQEPFGNKGQQKGIIIRRVSIKMFIKGTSFPDYGTNMEKHFSTLLGEIEILQCLQIFSNYRPAQYKAKLLLPCQCSKV